MRTITVEHLTKTYRVGVGRARVREMLPAPLDRATAAMFPRWWRKNTFDALDDVSLSVSRAESVGIVGHNGAGKTTLLKIIAEVTAPTRGRATTAGRAAALIDVLVGFHPELTGRENAFLLGAVYGLGRRAMEPRIDHILEFAEIGGLADTPIKRFSTGMAARLGFATLTAMDVDILLVDEVLAVGDASFQRKCVKWLEGFREAGGTLLFVSHNMSLLRSMTERAIRLDHGQLVDDGPTGAVLARYATSMERRDGDGSGLQLKRDAKKAMRGRGLHRWGAGGARVEEAHLDGPSADGVLTATISYTAQDLAVGSFQLGFLDEAERELGGLTSGRIDLEAEGTVQCTVDPLPLQPGIYFPVVAITTEDGRVRDRWRLDRAVVVEGEAAGPSQTLGPITIPGSWTKRVQSSPRREGGTA